MNVPYDKALHFAACYLITLLLYPLMGWWGAAFAVLAGIGKEMFDYDDYGRFSWEDIAADLAGTATAILTIIIAKMI